MSLILAVVKIFILTTHSYFFFFPKKSIKITRCKYCILVNVNFSELEQDHGNAVGNFPVTYMENSICVLILVILHFLGNRTWHSIQNVSFWNQMSNFYLLANLSTKCSAHLSAKCSCELLWLLDVQRPTCVMCCQQLQSTPIILTSFYSIFRYLYLFHAVLNLFLLISI